MPDFRQFGEAESSHEMKPDIFIFCPSHSLSVIIGDIFFYRFVYIRSVCTLRKKKDAVCTNSQHVTNDLPASKSLLCH